MRGKVPKPRGCARVSVQAPQSHAIDASGYCRILRRSDSAPNDKIADGNSVSSTFTTASPADVVPCCRMMSESFRPVSLSRMLAGPLKRAAIAASDSAMMRARSAGSAKRSRIFAMPPSCAHPGMISAASAVCPARYGYTSAATQRPAALDCRIIANTSSAVPCSRPCTFMCVNTGTKPVPSPIAIVSSIPLRELKPDSGVRRS